MPTKEELKQSMDARWRKNQFNIYLIVMGGVLFFSLLILLIAWVEEIGSGIQSDAGPILVVILIYAAMFLPIILWISAKYRAIFAHPEQFRVYTVELNRPSLSYWYRGAAYFTVDIRLENGYTFSRDTKPLWSNALFAPFSLNDYVNRKIKVAYNAEEDTLICLGFADTKYGK